jgi:hypothetical protein
MHHNSYEKHIYIEFNQYTAEIVFHIIYKLILKTVIQYENILSFLIHVFWRNKVNDVILLMLLMINHYTLLTKNVSICKFYQWSSFNYSYLLNIVIDMITSVAINILNWFHSFCGENIFFSECFWQIKSCYFIRYLLILI